MREGMKSNRGCVFRCDLDMETLVCTRGRFSRWHCWPIGSAVLGAAAGR